MNRLVNFLYATKNRQDVIWNIASFGLTGVLGLLMNVIIAHYYPPDVLGVFNQIYAVYILFSQIAVGGTHLSVLKHVPQNIEDQSKIKQIFTAALILTVLTSLFVSVIFALIGFPVSQFLKSPDIATGILYAAPGLFLFALGKVFQAFLNGLSKMKAYAVCQAARYILIFTFILLFCIFNVNGIILPVAFTLAEILLFFAMLILLRKWLDFSNFVQIKFWIKQHFSFGTKVVIGHILLDINSRVDVLVLGYFSSDNTVGIYSFAAILAEGFYSLAMVLRNNVNPQLTKNYYEDKEKLKNLIQQWKKKAYLIFVPMGVVGIGLFPVVTWIMQKESYISGWLAFSLIMAGLIISVGYLPFQMILNQTGYPGRHAIYIFLFFLTNLILNIVLIPIMGMTGSGLATGLAFVIQVIYLKIMVKKKLAIDL